MQQLSPLPLKEKYYKAVEKEINRLFYEIMYRPIIRALEVPEKEIENSSDKAPLYIKRKVLNAADLIAWAEKHGFKSCLPAKDLHVTICRSRAGVCSKSIEKKSGCIFIDSKAGRKMAHLGDDGAAVLFFQSSIIESRWRQLIEKHSASWDYDSFHPHITISYNPGDIDLAALPAYDGPLHLGPEIHEKPLDGWRLKIKELVNAADPLESAIRKGSIYFESGLFKGSFNARTSKQLREIGARFNPKSKTWSYSGVLPPGVSMASADADARYSAVKDRLIASIDSVDLDEINSISSIPDVYDRTIEEMEEAYQKTIKSISLAPKLTQAQKGMIAAEWGQNLDKYVKEWTQENILELRQKIQENAFAGRRSSAIIKEIQKNYGVSKRKAKFLARQETSLLMSKFRETRYKSIGSNRYRWSGSMDERERHDHKMLEGQIFSWDEPPVTNTKTGARNHPGEDFGCRCVAIPVIE